uniref:Large ribosomal subunit protein mL42 n=1 Tax=Amazona collaria TaxID=241587 RepID=A0A8B9IUS0_9PSIT
RPLPPGSACCSPPPSEVSPASQGAAGCRCSRLLKCLRARNWGRPAAGTERGGGRAARTTCPGVPRGEPPAEAEWCLVLFPVLRRLRVVEDGAVYRACHKSTYSVLPEDYNCKVELAVTSDLKTIVCYHPSLEIPYEHTKPIPRPDPVNNKEENLDQVLKSRLNEKELKNDQGPTIEELSKMFYTTKHRWYPVGQYHRRRRNPNPPKDR